MPKLILRCNYLKNAPPSHLQNFVQYIGTREGVEKVSDTTALLPATAKQKELIQDILNRIEDADRMHEYYDYIQKPTRENASEFITQEAVSSDVFLMTTRLLRHLGNVFADESERRRSGSGATVDRKLRRKIREKKIAQGHAEDDHAQVQTM